MRSPKLTVGCSHSSLHTNNLPCCCSIYDEQTTAYDFSYAAVSAHIDNSLKLLKTEVIDLLQVRSPKLTVGCQQSSYILMTYRVVGADSLRPGAAEGDR